MGRGGEGGVGGVTGAFFFLEATFLRFAIFLKMGASFSSSVGGAEERLEESESSMVVIVALFLNSGQRDATSEGARLNSRQVWGKLVHAHMRWLNYLHLPNHAKDVF